MRSLPVRGRGLKPKVLGLKPKPVGQMRYGTHSGFGFTSPATQGGAALLPWALVPNPFGMPPSHHGYTLRHPLYPEDTPLAVKGFFHRSGASVEFLAIEIGVSPEHPVDRMEKLPHYSDKGLHTCLLLGDQLLVERLDLRLVTDRDQRWHEEVG